VKTGETTADGKFTLVEAECLGSCGTAPAAQVGDEYYENLTEAGVDAILSKLR
jgi:NADH:ubiquinone oxidoreductase subunit E